MPDSAYMLFALTVTDAETHESYLASAGDSLRETGAEVIFGTDELDFIEGSAPFSRLVLLKFPSEAAARDWYDSAPYVEARQLRFDSAESSFAVLVGASAAIHHDQSGRR